MGIKIGSSVVVMRSMGWGGLLEGDFGVVTDIKTSMTPGEWGEHAEVFFQRLRKKVFISVETLNTPLYTVTE